MIRPQNPPLRTALSFRLRASFTVEASLLLPPVLLTCLTVLFLTAHVSNRAAMTAYAAEQAVSGREQEITVLYLSSGCEKNTVSEKKKRTVSYDLTTTPYLAGAVWEDTIHEVYEIPDTVRMLQIAAAMRTITANGGTS